MSHITCHWKDNWKWREKNYPSCWDSSENFFSHDFAQPNQAIQKRLIKNILRAFPPTRHLSAFLSFLATPFFSRLRKEKKRRRWEYNEPFLVRLLRRSSYLLRAIPYPVDTKGDFPFFSSCFPSTFALLHYVSFHLSHDRAPTSLLSYPLSRTRRAFTRSCNCRKETSTGARNLHRTASFSTAQGCISERIAISCRRVLRVYTSDERSFREVKISRCFMFLEGIPPESEKLLR